MSIANEIEVTCPSCGHEQEMTIWSSINVTINEELRERLFNAEINFLTCVRCDHRAFVDTPLMYHDMDKRFCIHYVPEDHLQMEGLYEAFNIDGKEKAFGVRTDIMEESQYLLEPHIVFEMKEMINYIIFRENLYERWAGSSDEK